ncbi:hypothetical protein SCA6_019488 [Theobroma cacao]
MRDCGKQNQSDYHPPKLLPAAKDASTTASQLGATTHYHCNYRASFGQITGRACLLKALDMTSSAVDCMKCSKAERFTGIPDLRL